MKTYKIILKLSISATTLDACILQNEWTIFNSNKKSILRDLKKTFCLAKYACIFHLHNIYDILHRFPNTTSYQSIQSFTSPAINQFRVLRHQLSINSEYYVTSNQSIQSITSPAINQFRVLRHQLSINSEYYVTQFCHYTFLSIFLLSIIEIALFVKQIC